MNGPSVGGNFKLYRNTGTYASPTWSIVAEISDVAVSELTRNIAELKRRSSDFIVGLPAKIQMISVDIKMIHGIDATNFAAFKDAFFNATVIELAILDGIITTTGTQGLRLGMLVEQFPWGQPLEEVSDHDVVVKSAYYESPAGTVRDPSWITIPTTTT